MFIDQPFHVKDLRLKNRIVMPPMCMFSSDREGRARDFHHVHYATRAMGGVSLVIQEATAVAPNGRISDADLGIWSDEQIEGLSGVTRLVHRFGAASGIQLAHAGRKCNATADRIVAPSAASFDADSRMPEELTQDEIGGLVADFRSAAARAAHAGYDLIEVHGAHGYLIHEFLSPLSNRRTDRFGGSTENRVRFLREILTSIHEVWPAEKPVQIRLSASDYLDGGLEIDETVRIVDLVKDLADLFHISSGGLQSAPIKPYPGYQVGFSEKVKRDCRVQTIAVGQITTFEQAEDILGHRRADLVALGRELLKDPYWMLHQKRTHPALDIDIPEAYARGFNI